MVKFVEHIDGRRFVNLEHVTEIFIRNFNNKYDVVFTINSIDEVYDSFDIEAEARISIRNIIY